MIYTATCKMGLESVVARELEELGIAVVRKEDVRVIFEGSYLDMARACLWLRCAERVLMIIAEFRAVTFEELFENVRHTELSPYFKRDSFIHVTGKSAKSTLFSVSDCQSIVKKAVVENLKSAFKTSVLPETGNRVILEVGILRDNVTLALDACGAGLSRRGYRIHNYDAPIAESLGAGVLRLSHFKPDMPLLDPMCGSGTMPIEAAMMAQNMAVGLGRSFAAEKWHFIPSDTFTRAREEACDLKRTAEKLLIFGSDIDERAIALSKQHAKLAGVNLNWRIAPVSDLDVSEFPKGILVCNPPYGERMFKKDETEKLYREMRRIFDKMPSGWSKNIITAYPEFERVYGKRADKRRNLSNGGKKCTLYTYLFEKTPAKRGE